MCVCVRVSSPKTGCKRQRLLRQKASQLNPNKASPFAGETLNKEQKIFENNGRMKRPCTKRTRLILQMPHSFWFSNFPPRNINKQSPRRTMPSGIERCPGKERHKLGKNNAFRGRNDAVAETMAGSLIADSNSSMIIPVSARARKEGEVNPFLKRAYPQKSAPPGRNCSIATHGPRLPAAQKLLPERARIDQGEGLSILDPAPLSFLLTATKRQQKAGPFRQPSDVPFKPKCTEASPKIHRNVQPSQGITPLPHAAR